MIIRILIFILPLSVWAQQCPLFDADVISTDIATAYLANNRVRFEAQIHFALIKPEGDTPLNKLAKLELNREQRQVVFAWAPEKIQAGERQLVITWPRDFSLVARLMSQGLNMETYNALRASVYLPPAKSWEFLGYLVDLNHPRQEAVAPPDTLSPSTAELAIEPPRQGLFFTD